MTRTSLPINNPAYAADISGETRKALDAKLDICALAKATGYVQKRQEKPFS